VQQVCQYNRYYSRNQYGSEDPDGNLGNYYTQSFLNNPYGYVNQQYQNAYGFVQENVVTLAGSLHIGGLQTSTLSPEDITLVQNVIAEEFAEAFADAETSAIEGDVAQQMVTITSRDTLDTATTVDRSLEATVDASATTASLPLSVVNFNVRVVAEKFGVDGSNARAVSGLVVDLSGYLHHSMKTGLFTTKLVVKARAEEVINFQKIKSVKLISLDLVSELKNKPYYHEFVNMADVLLAVALLVGLAVGLLAVHSLFNKYFPPKPVVADKELPVGSPIGSKFGSTSTSNGVAAVSRIHSVIMQPATLQNL